MLTQHRWAVRVVDLDPVSRSGLIGRARPAASTRCAHLSLRASWNTVAVCSLKTMVPVLHGTCARNVQNGGHRHARGEPNACSPVGTPPLCLLPCTAHRGGWVNGRRCIHRRRLRMGVVEIRQHGRKFMSVEKASLRGRLLLARADGEPDQIAQGAALLGPHVVP
jgi:hypothetical protein